MKPEFQVIFGIGLGCALTTFIVFFLRPYLFFGLFDWFNKPKSVDFSKVEDLDGIKLAQIAAAASEKMTPGVERALFDALEAARDAAEKGQNSCDVPLWWNIRTAAEETRLVKELEARKIAAHVHCYRDYVTVRFKGA